MEGRVSGDDLLRSTTKTQGPVVQPRWSKGVVRRGEKGQLIRLVRAHTPRAAADVRLLLDVAELWLRALAHNPEALGRVHDVED